jgi:hypothetical protein
MSFRLDSRAALLVAAVLLLGLVAAAPAQIKVKQTPDEKAAAERAAEEDPALQAHIAYLMERIEHKNRIIRRSAHQGLTGIGKAALPSLQALAADPSTPRGKIAARLVKTIEKRMERQANRADRPKKNKARTPSPGGPVTQDQVAEALTAIGSDASAAPKVLQIIQAHRKRLRGIKQEMKGASPDAARARRIEAMETYLNELGGELGQARAALFLRALDRQRMNNPAPAKKKGRKKGRKARAKDPTRAGDA